jgi:hypothetical protein
MIGMTLSYMLSGDSPIIESETVARVPHAGARNIFLLASLMRKIRTNRMRSKNEKP